MTVLSLTQLFAGDAYAGPALLGLMLASALAILLRHLGRSTLATILVSCGVLLWYLALIFEARSTFFGLPTPAALGGVARSLAGAYQHSLVDYAPIPVRPGYVIMVVAGMWIVTTLGEIATFRWRNPLVITLPLVGLFGFVVVVGTGRATGFFIPLFITSLLTYWGLESAHRFRSWGRWVAAWRHGPGEEPESVTGILARRMGAACVLLSIAAPVFLPAIGKGILSWRNPGGGGLGAGEFTSGQIDPLVSVVPQLIRQTDRQLFEVRAPRPGYWRLVTLSRFDGEIWLRESEATASAPHGIITPNLPRPQPARAFVHEFTIRALEGRALPAAGLPRQVSFHGAAGDDLAEDLVFDASGGNIELQRPILEGMRYTVRSMVPDASYGALRKARIGEIGDEYLQLPADLSPQVRDLARRWTRGARTPFEMLLAIQNQLRGFEHSLDVEKSASADYLRDFLLVTRRGYCQQFATAFAVLARTLGFPARVAVGFLPGETAAEAPDRYIVRGTDTHAWPEIFFEGFGWVRFEPTPRSAAVPPEYTARAGDAATGPAGTETDLRTIGRGLRGQEEPGFGQNRDREGRNAPRRRGGDEETSEWTRTFSTLWRGLALLVILFLIGVPSLKALRSRSRYRRARAPRDLAVAAFLEFEENAAELASPRAASESALSYVARIARQQIVPPRPALRLATIYEAAQYAPRPLGQREGHEARRLSRELRARLWERSTMWAKAARLFSPAGLARRL